MGRLTIVVDNFPHDSSLRRDWGFSALVEDQQYTLLFDLGNKDEVFKHNVEKLGIDLSSVDCLFLSHSDYDHVGGLETFLERNRNANVFIPKGFDKSLIDKIRSSGHEVVELDSPANICGRFFSTGSVTPSTRAEHSLFFETERGFWIVAGCSHPKVWNIIDVVKEFTKKVPYLYIGGYHFFRLFDEDLKEAVSRIKESGISKVAPCHCTGEEARRLLKEVFKEDFVEVGVGKVLDF